MADESKLEKKVILWARKHDILPLKLSLAEDGGWPDRLWLFYYPAIAFIEFKSPGRKPDLRQSLRIAELHRRGYPIGVFDDYDSAIEFLTQHVLKKT